MTPTEKLKATMDALGISAEGLRIRQCAWMLIVWHGTLGMVVYPSRGYLHSAIQNARFFGIQPKPVRPW